ncbi:MAG TPA: aminoglycoside phosphotransferase family protein [bacterium]|nr:aminoglycoside phosphotransferase family protein [bacterium]
MGADAARDPGLRAVGSAFSLPGDFLEGGPYGSGHINDTYVAAYGQAGTRVRYIHQRINQGVFRDVPGLMDNIRRVAEHQCARLERVHPGDLSRRVLRPLPAADGRRFFTDPSGACWRTYYFIEGAKTYDVIESDGQAYAAARAFGAFQGALADLPGARLRETIPHFHDSPRRFQTLEEALASDKAGRAAGCARETDFALAQKGKVGRLLELSTAGLLPERVTHNDTKLNNVLLDDATGEGVCVIDLDTVMPGLAAYDFGDMVRTATMPVAEDERDLGKVVVQWGKFEAIARGYLSSAGAFLNRHEKETLAFAGWLMTFEVGIRFLADHLQGDRYFKVRRENHNLDRARTQFALAQDIERKLGKMSAFIAEIGPHS